MRYFYQTFSLVLLSTFVLLFFNISAVEAGVIVRPPNNLGLVGYWSFDEGRGTQASDLSGNGNDGVLNGDPQWVSGKAGGALGFDGVGDYSYVSDDSTLKGMSELTISMWVYHDSVSGGDHDIIWKGPHSANEPFGLWRDAGTASYAFLATDNTGDYSGVKYSNFDALLSEWIHITVVFVGDNQVRMFFNGAEDSASPFVISTTGEIAETADDLFIGTGAGLSNFFSGKIDEVRIYNRALSDAEVQSLYANTKSTVVGENTSNYYSDGLVAHWTFDGAHKTTTTLTDRAGSNDGTIYGAVPTLGRIGQAMEFDGSNDYVALDMFFNTANVISEMTVGAWVKVNSGEGNWSILDFDRSDYFTATISGNATDANKVGFHTAASGSAVHDMSSTSVVADGEWHHVTWVYDGTDKIIYIDGGEDTRAINPHGGLGLGVGNTRYGFLGDGSEATALNGSRNNLYFDGIMDDVRYYNRALSADEIQGLAGGGFGTIGSSSPFLLFDDFTGSLLHEDRWQTFGTNYGTILVSDGELTITNSTGSSTNYIGAASQVRFPVGTTFKARVKNTEGRHSAVVAIGESPFYPFPHAGGSNVGASLYSRADNISATMSLRRESGTTATGTPGVQDYRNYQILELRRVTADLIEFYVDGVKVGQFTTAGLTNDYFVYFSADGHTKPNTIVVDRVEVTEQ